MKFHMVRPPVPHDPHGLRVGNIYKKQVELQDRTVCFTQNTGGSAEGLAEVQAVPWQPF